MSTSPLRMVLDDLKELFRVRKAFSVAEYKEAMKAHHRAENSMFLLREQGRSQGVLTHEHYQALRMVMDDIKELLIAKELTVEQYRAQLAAAHDRSLAEEASDLIAAGAAACGLPEVDVSVTQEKMGTLVPVKEIGLASDRIAAGGAAGGSTRKGDDAELNGMCEGQGLSSNSSLSANGMSDRVAAGGAAGGPSRKGDDAEQKGMCEGQGKSSDSNPSANGMSTIGPPRGAGEAEGHSGSCDAEALTPGVEVSATKGMTEHVAEEGHVLKHPKANASNLKVTLESSVQWFLWQQKPNQKIFVEQPPSDLTPFGGSSVTDTSWACCQNFGVEEDLGLKLETMILWSASLMNFVGGAFVLKDPGKEGVSVVRELNLTQGEERATCGGRAAPLY